MSLVKKNNGFFSGYTIFRFVVFTMVGGILSFAPLISRAQEVMEAPINPAFIQYTCKLWLVKKIYYTFMIFLFIFLRKGFNNILP